MSDDKESDRLVELAKDAEVLRRQIDQGGEALRRQVEQLGRATEQFVRDARRTTPNVGHGPSFQRRVVTAADAPDTKRTRHGKLLISAPSQRVTREHWSDTDHPCIKRSARPDTNGKAELTITARHWDAVQSQHRPAHQVRGIDKADIDGQLLGHDGHRLVEVERRMMRSTPRAGAAVGLMLAFRRQHLQEIATVPTDLNATERRITELYTKAMALTVPSCQNWTRPKGEVGGCCWTGTSSALERMGGSWR